MYATIVPRCSAFVLHFFKKLTITLVSNSEFLKFIRKLYLISGVAVPDFLQQAQTKQL